MSQNGSLVKLTDLEQGTTSLRAYGLRRGGSTCDTAETTGIERPRRSEPGSMRFAEVPCRIDARTYMSVFFCGTVALIIGHHFYYHHLDGSRVGRIDDDAGYWVPNPGKDWTTQPIVNATANIFTKLVVLCVSCLAWVAFTQIFWRKLATQGSTLRNIDSLMRFRASVTNIPIWAVFRRMLGLLLVGFCAAAADFMTAFIPGSLMVSEGFTQDTCTVPVPDLSRAQFIQSTFNPSTPASLQPNRNALSLATSASVTGAYLAPGFAFGDASSYEVTYLAPRLRCDNITQSTDISDFLPMRPDGISVWYAAADQGPTQASFVIVARGLDDGSASSPLPPVEQLPSFALRCTLWSSTYTINVDMSNGPGTAAIMYLRDERQVRGLNDVLGADGSVSEQQMYALWLAFTEQLSGNVTYIPETNQLNSTNNLLGLTSVTKGTLPNSRQWDVEEWRVELLMQNMVLSLLSMSSGAFPDNSPSTYETTCGFPGLKYEYFVANLWGPYGGVIFLAAVCLIWGWVARQKNARNETLDFSRVLSACPRNEHGTEGPKITLDTWVIAGEDGHLVIR